MSGVCTVCGLKTQVFSRASELNVCEADYQTLVGEVICEL